MLVLSRRVDERIIIGGNIVVTVVRICGNRVKLGVTAPLEINVRRSELAPPERNPHDRTD